MEPLTSTTTQDHQDLLQLINSCRAHMSIVDLNYRYTCVNDAYLRAYLLQQSDILGRRIDELLGLEAFNRVVKPNLDKCFAGVEVQYNEEFSFKGYDSPRFMDVHYRPHRDEHGQIIGALVSAHDVTHLKAREKRLQALAHIDSLTLLPNRQHITLLMSKAMAHALREHKGFSIAFCDIDQFKTINDSAGHQVGDLVLQVLARRLQQVMRSYEHVGRLSGDEFLMIFNDEMNPSQQDLIRERLQESLSEVIDINGFCFTPSISLGFAHYPNDGNSIKTLINQADQRMYQVKPG